MAPKRIIPIRMSEEQIALLKAAAGRAGLGLGPWLRSLGLREANAVPAAPAPRSSRRVKGP